MDSRVGLDYIVENPDYTSKLGAGESVNWGEINYAFCNPEMSFSSGRLRARVSGWMMKE